MSVDYVRRQFQRSGRTQSRRRGWRRVVLFFFYGYTHVQPVTLSERRSFFIFGHLVSAALCVRAHVWDPLRHYFLRPEWGAAR